MQVWEQPRWIAGLTLVSIGIRALQTVSITLLTGILTSVVEGGCWTALETLVLIQDGLRSERVATRADGGLVGLAGQAGHGAVEGQREAAVLLFDEVGGGRVGGVRGEDCDLPAFCGCRLDDINLEVGDQERDEAVGRCLFSYKFIYFNCGLVKPGASGLELKV